MDVDRIAGSFKDQVVFMTGATGFMGKVFLERLLRLTDVRKVFVLIRPKRSKNSEERLLKILANPLFEVLKTKMSVPEILSKVHLIAGDCSYKDLNIAPADRATVVTSTTMMFHFAATVNFNEKFKRAIELNVRGTREMIKLALECGPRLLVFCQVSTAFSHLHEKLLMEKIYDASADPDEVIETSEKFSEEKVEEMFRKYLCKTVPNSYVFTKALSETLVAEAHYKHKLPLLLCRPAIIMSMFHDPVPGWNENLNNIAGITTAIGFGVLRTLIHRSDTELNVMPVDYAISNIFSATWDYLVNHQSTLRVVNLEYEPVHTYTLWPHMLHCIRELYPFEISLWYPRCNFTHNKLVHAIEYVFFQLTPALLIDGILRLIGKKPILMRANNKIYKEVEAIRIFMDNRWSFSEQNMRVINKLMNDLERERYGTEDRDKNRFSEVSTLGIRRYVLKQDDKSIPGARRRVQIMYYADWCIKLAMLGGIVYYLFNLFVR